MKKNLLFILILSVASAFYVKAQPSGEGIPHHKNLNVYYTDEEMDIDGVDDEDVWSEVTPVAHLNLWVWDEGAQDMVWQDGQPDSADFYPSFKMVWDSSAIYFFADVTDDVLIKYADHQSLDPWNCDDIEFYVHWRYGKADGDTSVNGAAGMRNTSFQIGLNIGAPAGSPPTWVNNEWNTLEDNDPIVQKIEYAFTLKQGGYRCEMKVPFSIWDGIFMDTDGTVTVPYEKPDSIAFEVSFTDVDTDEGGGPIMVWNCDSTADGLKISWKPNYWGKATFIASPVAVHDVNSSFSSMKFYPNPTTNILVIENAEVMESVTISNIVGQRVKYINNLKERKVEVNMSGLQDGIYFITTKDINGKTRTAKVIKK